MLSLTADLETNLLHKIGFSLFMALIRSVPERGVNVNEQLKYMSFDKECMAAIVPKRDFCRILLFFYVKTTAYKAYLFILYAF